MDLAQDKTDLIESIIKSDRKFSGNEDLFEDFFNETCKRSILIVRSVSNDTTLKAYLRRIATTAILNVLKNEGRLRRTRSGYSAVQTVPVENVISSTFDYSYASVAYEPVDIQDTPEDAAIKKDILQSIIDAVYEVDRKNSDKLYLKLYNLRFEKGLTQKEIAQELDISQSEVSKRLFKLMDEVKQILG